MNISKICYPVKTLLWITDLHLNKLDCGARTKFFDDLKSASFDALLITGDISNASCIEQDLAAISTACGTRPIFFVLGNHDYFGSNFSDVDRSVHHVCRKHRNLIPLGHGEIISLSRSTALVGHKGWFDGRSGAGETTPVVCPDRYQVEDFSGLDHIQFFQKLEVLGKESAQYFRRVLPMALQCHSNVLLGTHVPPFTQALRFDDGFCDWTKQPYFSNRAMGNTIWGMAQHFPKKEIHVYAGHTHSEASIKFGYNLSVDVANACFGKTVLGKILVIR